MHDMDGTARIPLEVDCCCCAECEIHLAWIFLNWINWAGGLPGKVDSDQVNGHAPPTEAGLFLPGQTESEKADQWVPYLQRIQRLQGRSVCGRDLFSSLFCVVSLRLSLSTCTINKGPAVGRRTKTKKSG